MSKPTPMQKVIRAFNRLSADEFHKYIYDYGDVLLEEEKDYLSHGPEED
jgi:alpha-glucuronidase